MVSPTRRIIEAKLGPVLEDEDAIFRVAMTAHELLENAAKYASDGKARLELSVTPRDEGAIVRVVVSPTTRRRSTSPSWAPATPR